MNEAVKLQESINPALGMSRCYKQGICKLFPDKMTFDTYYAAEIVLKTHQKGRAYGKSKRKFATKNLKRVYKCPDCKKYHLTSKI